MSLHLYSTPLPLDLIVNSLYLEDISKSTYNTDFKVKTIVDDMDLLEDILESSLLGFKNKRALINYENKGVMYFYFNDGTIEILFSGNYSKEKTKMFIENINKEYLIRTHQYTEEKVEQKTNIATNHEHVETKKPEKKNHIKNKNPIVIEPVKEPPKKLRITTNMTNFNLIKSVQKDSYIGFNSEKELKDFENIGQIVQQKNQKGTYDIIFIGNYDKNQAQKYVENLYNEYALKVQEETYLNVLEKIKKNNYRLESEIVDNQNSIVLTLNIDN